MKILNLQCIWEKHSLFFKFIAVSFSGW